MIEKKLFMLYNIKKSKRGKRGKMKKYQMHSDFKKLEKIKLPLVPRVLPVINFFLRKVYKRIKPFDGIVETPFELAREMGKSVSVTMYEPTGIVGLAPCMIYFHGGAFCLESAPYHKRLLCEYSLGANCKVLFVDYALAPKNPFPQGVEDAYFAFTWLCENAQALEIDTTKIAVGGDSAGGALASAVCQIASDEASQIRPSFQLLVYPVTDMRQNSQSMHEFVDTPMWNSKLNKIMWKLYLNGGVENDKSQFKLSKISYASPALTSSFAVYPPTYIEVAEFDCLKDEGIEFANSLKQANVDVELYQSKGTVHGYEFVKNSDVVRDSINRRTKALKSAFNK